MTRLILSILLLLAPAAAAAEASTLQEYFSSGQKGDDPAYRILGAITGPIAGIIDGVADSPLTAMFMIFNMAVFSVAILFILYGVLTGLLMTAWDGEFLGKEISSVWYPIRTVYGVIGLIPMFSGWTFPQILVIFCAVVGIGIGNQTWQAGFPAVLGHVDSMLITNPPVDSRRAGVDGLLSAQLCSQNHNQEQQTIAAETGKPPLLFTPHLTENTKEIRLTYGSADPQAGAPADACGGVSIAKKENPTLLDNLADAGGNPILAGALSLSQASKAPVFDQKSVEAAHKTALQQLAGHLDPWAKVMAQGQPGPNEEVVDQLRLQYASTVSSALAAAALASKSGFGGWMANDGQSFFYAGAIFPKVLSVNRDIATVANVDLAIIPASWRPDGGHAGMPLYDGIARAAAQFSRWTAEKYQALTSMEIPSVASFFDSQSSRLMHSSLHALLRGETDLMFGMINFGYSLLAGAGAIWSGGLMTTAGLGTISAGTWTSALNFLMAGLSGLLLPVALAGAVFAFYIPFLPAVIWYGGLLTYGILLLEALVAAPLWMIAHLDTEGKGLGPKTSHGYIFLLNLLFRPALMVFGLVGGWLMLRLFGRVLTEIMAVLYGSSSYGFSGMASIFMFIATVVIFAYLAMMTVNRLFGLIHHLPNEVISWVGGHLRGVGGDGGEGGERYFGAAIKTVERPGKRPAGGGIAPGPPPVKPSIDDSTSTEGGNR